MRAVLNKTYISNRLKEKLSDIPEYPLTTVVAPAGYGKSNAIRYFADTLPKGSKVLWQNILGSGTADFWRGFCDMFGSVSVELAEALSSMGAPPTDGTTQQEFLRLIRRAFESYEEVYVVIDDFHLVMNRELYNFLAFCTRNMGKRIHLVVISRRPVLRSEDMLLFAGSVNELTERELRFGSGDVEQYFAYCGCPISKSDAAWLAKISEGWIAVIYLNLRSFSATGKFADSVEIHTMMSEVLYTPLPEAQKKLLTTMSILLEWTEEQAAFIGDNAEAGALLKEMRRNNAFIYYSAYNGKYKLHHLLQESVQKVFVGLPEERRKAVLERAGQWFFREKDYTKAAGLFYNAKDFESLMTTVETCLGAGINAEHKEQMLRWFRDCPREILERHPTAMLVYARRLYTFHMQKECIEVLEYLRGMLQENKTISERLRRNILGEIEVNESFLEYNDVETMSIRHRRACELLDCPTTSVAPSSAWAFGGVSVLLDYHRKVGELEREIGVMKEAMPYWYRLNQNQGSGAEHLMEAERWLNMGRLDDAEICLHRAWNICTREKKLDMQIMTACAGIHLKLLRGEFGMVTPMLSEMRKSARETKHYMLLHTLDMCEAWFYALMGQAEPCAEWIAEGKLDVTRQLFPAVPTLQIVYRQVLLARKKYAAVIAREDDRVICRIFPNIACEIYLDIQLAAACQELGKHELAKEHLKAAMDMAMPDRLYMPFILNFPWIGGLIRLSDSESWPEERAELIQLGERYVNGRREIISKYSRKENIYDLSEREMEIASLAADRKTNREIAQTLHLSENTVKSTLRIVFQKLGMEDGGRGKKRELERILRGG